MNERFNQLSEALVYDSECEKVLTIEDRILINQERGRLLAGEEYPAQPPKLEEKLKYIYFKIKEIKNEG